MIAKMKRMKKMVNKEDDYVAENHIVIFNGDAHNREKRREVKETMKKVGEESSENEGKGDGWVEEKSREGEGYATSKEKSGETYESAKDSSAYNVEATKEKVKDGVSGFPNVIDVDSFQKDIDEEVIVAERELNIDGNAGFLSKFMKGYKSLLEDMHIHEKEVIDYCFFNDHSTNSNEILFTFRGRIGSGNSISRETISTLDAFTMISLSVIDIWCMLINKEETKRKESKRFCMDTIHSIFLNQITQTKDVEKNERCLINSWHSFVQLENIDQSHVDMILVPVILYRHFFAVVINFRDKKIQYLDNQKSNDPRFMEAVSLIKTYMACFLELLNHNKADEIPADEIENVGFNWQIKNHGVDCCVFLMHHLENFDGNNYTKLQISGPIFGLIHG